MTVGAWICLASPLASAILLVLLGTRIPRRTAGVIATTATAVAFAGAVVALVDTLGRDAEERQEVTTAWTWLAAGNVDVGLSLLVDPLSVVMMLIVSGVGSLIVGYSIGYMHGADEERRYFAYMSIFVFAMLLLVLSANYVILLAGWGLVGLASYLLIGFEHERPAAVAAAKKAFIMNAVGDATMVLAIFLLVWEAGTVDYLASFERIGGLSDTVVTLVALGMLGGAVAKSAQIPLHTWLPDAMEGPTPVSALIHAATMVTAGVYLLVRLHPVYEEAVAIQDLAAGLGALTLLVAGLIALVQTDIKRVIAYSTMSQIGYMFLGAGIAAYGNAIIHLMTHAVFKALLFLGAGIVIHALLGEQDMRRMGGLRRLLPRTYLAMLIGALALVGIPPLSGFFSKDAILASALADGGAWGYTLFAAGIAGAFLTGLYTFRMIFVAFGGEPSPYVREHFHGGHGEGPFSMTSVVAVLAVLSVVGGWLQIAGVWHPFSDFLDPVGFGADREHLALVEPSVTQDWVTSLLAVGAGGAGIAVAWALYAARRRAVPRQPALERTLQHKLWFDEAYDWAFYRPAAALARGWTRWVEGPVITGSLTAVARGARGAGTGVGSAQTGLLRLYVLALAAGVAILTLVFVSVR
ncbi:MAG TPA: NADH-quinone oxidoreductase subunit L [Gaiellaceae bacterium]|nr:NADH-quinone oxidoreductase subunit L [Gaiellaceae bacterium]